MANYVAVAARGMRIQLIEILDATNKRTTDLLTIPDYVVNGCPTVCWVHILGPCTFCDCAFKQGHLPRDKISDTFADEVASILAPGIQALLKS
jgi:hypothetical protein